MHTVLAKHDRQSAVAVRLKYHENTYFVQASERIEGRAFPAYIEMALDFQPYRAS